MAYDRYENRGNRSRDNDRGFFERAGDEIASWFGDDDRDRGRRDEERMSRERDWNRNRDWDNDRDRYAIGGWGERSGSESSRERFNRDPERDRWSDEQRGYQSTSSDRDYRRGWGGYDRDFSSRGTMGGTNRDYMSPTGPSYGYGGAYGSGSDRGYGSGGYGSSYRSDSDRREYDRSESPWGRDDYRNTSFAGSMRDNDRHYGAWRQRQLNDLDRDYEMYCRERQDRFENDFGTWRNERQTKRQHLGGIQEHMDVVGSDGETIGKVDKVRGDRVILTKSDSDDNRHHSFDCSLIESVEGDQVRLQVPAEEAKSRLSDDERGLLGREQDTTLERSFSGTYTR